MTRSTPSTLAQPTVVDAEPASFGADTDRALLQRAVAAARLAPSGHNTQPWLFRIDDDVLELRADRTRALPIVDPEDRALVISCGAALAHLRLAMRAAGRAVLVERGPFPADADLLARVRLGARRAVTGEELALHSAIPRRHTNRRPFETRSIPEALVASLVDTVRAEGAWLRLLTATGARRAVAALVAEGDRRQAADPAFRRELARWMHPNWSRSHDGMPGAAFGLGALASLPFPWIIRMVDWGSGQAARDRRLVEQAPALAVLGTMADAPGAWLRAGEALGMLLLRSCASGLSASFLNQPIEVPALRPELARAAGVAGYPQLLLRIGYGVEVPPTPRRSVEEVLLPSYRRSGR